MVSAVEDGVVVVFVSKFKTQTQDIGGDTSSFVLGTLVGNDAQSVTLSLAAPELLGELVWSESYKAADPQGQMSSHDGDIDWNGKNDIGEVVLNGVYIGYIKTDYGETAMTKIAVVK